MDGTAELVQPGGGHCLQIGRRGQGIALGGLGGIRRRIGQHCRLILTAGRQGVYCHQVRQHRLLHAAADGTADELRKQHGAVGGGEKLFHTVAVRTADVNVETLQLALIGIQSCQRCFGIAAGGIHALQHLRKALACDVIHTLFQFQIFVHKLPYLSAAFCGNTI